MTFDRSGKACPVAVSGRASAAASDTPPRIPLQPSTVSSARVYGGSPPRASRTNTGMLNIHAISPQSARPGPPRIFERPAHRQATNHVRQLKADKQEQHRLEQGREIVRCVRALMTGEDVDFEG